MYSVVAMAMRITGPAVGTRWCVRYYGALSGFRVEGLEFKHFKPKISDTETQGPGRIRAALLYNLCK